MASLTAEPKVLLDPSTLSPDGTVSLWATAIPNDGCYLMISSSHGTDPRNRVFYVDPPNPEWRVWPLLTDFDASYDFLDNEGLLFWFCTDLDAPRSRVIAIESRCPARNEWRELIPQTDDTPESVSGVA